MSQQNHIASKIKKLCPSEVECDHCGYKQAVNVSKCLREGWPKCCGETMKLNSYTKRSKQ